MANIASEFNDYTLDDFPGILRAIDSTHIPKSYLYSSESIVLQGVVKKKDLQFTDFNVGAPGSARNFMPQHFADFNCSTDQ